MSNPALDHLKALPAFVLTLRRTPERLAAFTAQAAPLFASVTPFMGFDAQDAVRDSVHHWRLHQHRVFTEHVPQMLVRRPGTPRRDELDRSATWRAASTTYAVYWSHMRMLEAALKSGHPRFVLCEDDIVPRSSLLAGAVPEPPVFGEFNIWSGAIPRATLKADSDSFTQGTPHSWVAVPAKVTPLLFGAGCYELTRDAAHHLWVTAQANPGQWDVVWALAMGHGETYRCAPEALTQVGQSARMSKVRAPAVVREERTR